MDCGQMDTKLYQTMLVILKVSICLFSINNIYIFCPGYNSLPRKLGRWSTLQCHLTDYEASCFISFTAEM